MFPRLHWRKVAEMPDTLQATWVPRIGEEATTELARYRKMGVAGPAVPFLAIAAGLLVGHGPLADVVGVTFVVIACCIVAEFVRRQRRLAATLSMWFGVKVTAGQLPLMNPSRFDAWREKRNLRHVE